MLIYNGMYKKKFKFDYIIYFFLTINILLFFFGLFKGFSKPFWIDEIHAIGFSQKIPQLNLKLNTIDYFNNLGIRDT